MKKPLLLVLVAICQAVFASDPVFDECHDQSCDVVVDIGYTGIRVHVYSYNAKTFRQDRKIQQIYEKKIHQSLNEIPVSEVNRTLETLFYDFPKQVLNIYVYATEGYRSLPIRQEIQYSQAIRQWFRQQKYLNLIEMRKISGHEEAFYAWISNDYSLGCPYYQTGIIEIGGGSTQVAVNVDSASNKFQVMQLISFNQKLTQVWTASLHDYGREKMSSRVNCHAPMDMGVCIGDLVKISQALEFQTLSKIHKFLQKKSFSVHWYGLGLLNHLGFSPYMNSKNHAYYQIAQLKGSEHENACMPAMSYAEKHDPYAQKACFNMAYAYTLTHELFGLDSATKIYYYPLNKGQGWPQGILIWRLLKNSN